jgi:ferredoxin
LHVYKLDENGMVYVDDEIVPDGMEALAQEGADACPQSALKLVAA